MAIKLHHAPPGAAEPSPPPEPAGPPPGPAQPRAPSPPLPTPAPEQIRAPAVDLKPRIPLRTEQRRARTLRLAAALLLVLPGAWMVKRLLPHRSRTLQASLQRVTLAETAPSDGVLVSAAPVGSEVEAGATLATLAPPGGKESAEEARLRASLARAEKTLSAALASQVEVERAYRSQRATLSEREEAGRQARAKAEERDALKRELQALTGTDSSTGNTALTVPETGWVVEALPVGARVARGAVVARLVSRRGRVVAVAPPSPPPPGSRVRVRLGETRLAGTVVEGAAGSLVVELQLSAPPAEGERVSVEMP